MRVRDFSSATRTLPMLPSESRRNTLDLASAMVACVWRRRVTPAAPASTSLSGGSGIARGSGDARTAHAASVRTQCRRNLGLLFSLAVLLGTMSCREVIGPDSNIGVSPTSFSFTGQQGGANPAGQSLSISNTGGGTLGWTATTNQSWLTVSSASGTVPSTVTVSVNTAGLAAGSYSGTVTVSAPGASNTPQTVAVSLTVTSPPLPPDPGVVFRWPVSPENRFNTSQDYAHFGVVVANRYHTGMDIAATEGTSVVAAGAGTVRRLSMTTGVFNGDNHCMGNVVIIDHGGVFSLYAHLQSITVANGAVVSKGAQIGTVGRTPTTSRPGCNPPTGAHLHFEMKTRGVLGDLGDSGPNWGYTPGNPDQYGYVDPTLYFHTWILLSTRTVRTTGVVNARMGPNSTAPENYPVLESLAPDVPVTAVALASATAACTGGWYLVVRPSGAFFGGVPTAWICASLTAP